jgi:hypothetical protein
MRVAVLTHHWVPNFGANLQALSTFHFLKKMGHEPVVLNYRPYLKEEKEYRDIDPRQLLLHEECCDTFLKQSRVLRDKDEISAFCSEARFDAIIAGSDIVIRLRRSGDTEDMTFPNPFWLTWAHSLNPRPRLGFLAASAGGSYYWLLPKLTRKAIADAVSHVDYVSVRDRWSQFMLRWATKGRLDPSMCPDPVSVLNKVFEVPKSFSEEPVTLRKKYVLMNCSHRHFSARWIHNFVEICHHQGLQVFSLPWPQAESRLRVDRTLHLPMHPLAWYSWIKNAAGIVAMRFHPVVCSIFNNVPFVSIDVSAPIHLRCFAIRRASKAYDICMNIDSCSRSFVPLYGRLLLSPERAVRMLAEWDSLKAEEYTTCANQDFAKTVLNILGNGSVE